MAFGTTDLQGTPYIGPVPSEWKWHIAQIGNRFQRLKTLTPFSDQYDAESNQLFQQINMLYRQCTSAVPEAFNKGLCFARAKQVEEQKLFSEHPGSENRLKPLAINYLRLYDCLKHSITDQSPDVLKILHELAQAHQSFFKQYGAEICRLKGNDGSVIAVTHAKQVRQWVAAFLLAMEKQDHSVFVQMATKIEERNPEAILLLPNLLVYFLACNHQQSIPDFLAKYAVEIGTLRNLVTPFSTDELRKMNRSLFGEEMQLSLEAQEALKKMKEIGALCHRDDEQAELAAGLFDALFTSLGQVLAFSAYTLSSLRQHPDLFSELSRLNPYEQIALLWIVYDQPFSQALLSKRFPLLGFERAKQCFAELSLEKQSQFIGNILRKEENFESSQWMLKRDFDYFSNKLSCQDEEGLLIMQMRLVMKHFSSN